MPTKHPLGKISFIKKLQKKFKRKLVEKMVAVPIFILILHGLSYSDLLPDTTAPLSSPPPITDLDELIKKIQAKEDKIKDLKFNFIQEIEFSVTDEKQYVAGELIFRKPNKILLKQSLPQEQIMVSNGKKLWIYNPRTNQVFVDRWKNWKGITYFLPGNFHPKGKISYLKKYYSIKLTGSSGENGCYLLVLTPGKKGKKSKYLPEEFQFHLWVDATDMLPRKSKLVSETFTCITEIKDWQINLNPGKKIFRFDMPENAEVMELEIK